MNSDLGAKTSKVFECLLLAGMFLLSTMMVGVKDLFQHVRILASHPSSRRPGSRHGSAAATNYCWRVLSKASLPPSKAASVEASACIFRPQALVLLLLVLLLLVVCRQDSTREESCSLSFIELQSDHFAKRTASPESNLDLRLYL